MFRVELPLPMYKKRGKYRILGLNDYRNLHYQVLNKAKQEYKSIVQLTLSKKQMSECLKDNLTVLYRIWFARKNRKDLSNYGTVVDKFFLDALVECGVLKDDRIPYIVETRYVFGGYGYDGVEVEIVRRG